jgi:hypothetical protein
LSSPSLMDAPYSYMSSLRNRKIITDQRSSCSQHFSCSHVEPFFQTLRIQQVKQAFKDFFRKVVFYRSKWKYVLTWMNAIVRIQ